VDLFVSDSLTLSAGHQQECTMSQIFNTP